MTEPLTVTGRIELDAQGRTWVAVPRRSACQSCGKSSGCGMSVLGGLAGGQKTRLPIAGMDAREGDTVALSCAPGGLLKAAFLAYGLPVLGLVLGAGAAALMNLNDASQMLGAGAGLVAGLLLARLAAKHGRTPTLRLIEE